jgi:hypothetical protein
VDRYSFVAADFHAGLPAHLTPFIFLVAQPAAESLHPKRCREGKRAVQSGAQDHSALWRIPILSRMILTNSWG